MSDVKILFQWHYNMGKILNYFDNLYQKILGIII